MRSKFFVKYISWISFIHELSLLSTETYTQNKFTLFSLHIYIIFSFLDASTMSDRPLLHTRQRQPPPLGEEYLPGWDIYRQHGVMRPGYRGVSLLGTGGYFTKWISAHGVKVCYQYHHLKFHRLGARDKLKKMEEAHRLVGNSTTVNILIAWSPGCHITGQCVTRSSPSHAFMLSSPLEQP